MENIVSPIPRCVAVKKYEMTPASIGRCKVMMHHDETATFEQKHQIVRLLTAVATVINKTLVRHGAPGTSLDIMSWRERIDLDVITDANEEIKASALHAAYNFIEHPERPQI